jgi:hypothetical protein
MKQLSNRKFNGVTVRIIYYPEERYSKRDFSYTAEPVSLTADGSELKEK